MLDKDMFSTNIFNIANVDAEKIFNSIAEDEKETSPSRKRRKLDDFTPQERMIRRKLKNRVAAQTARDKKRERMTELEKVVCRLENENKDLKKSNDDLKLRMEQLIEQNEELRIHVGIDKLNTNNNDHTYTRKADSTVTDQAVIKKEEVSKEHAEEIKSTSCFLDHDLVSKSQTDELLGLLERIEPGAFFEGFTAQEACVADELSEDVQVSGGAAADQPEADLSGLSAEDTSELFDLCRDIQDMVGGPSCDLKTVDDDTFFMDLDKLVDEKTKSDNEQLNTNENKRTYVTTPDFSPSHSPVFTTMNIGFENLVPFHENASDDESMDELFSELFPSLLQ